MLSEISQIETAFVNNRNQYTLFDAQPLAYDPNGNTKSLFGKQLSYNYANRLTKVITPDGTTTTMSYDALGRRTAVSVNGQTTSYFWSGQQALEEYGSAGTLQTSYVYSRGIDEVVQMWRSGQDYFYHMNSIGSVKAITNAAGNVIERYDYDPYGGQTIRADNTPPAVEQVRLKAGNLHIRFTESIRQQTFVATIRDASAQDVTLAATFEEADRKVVLQPNGALLPGTQYTLTIQAELSDLNGNRTGTNFEQSFVVSGDEIYFDGKAPEVESVTISGGKNVKVRFTEEIAEFPTGAIALELNSQPVAGTLSFVSSALEASYTLTDTAVPGVYTLTLSSAIQDEAIQSLATFNQVLLIAVPDQQLYELQRDVVSDSTIGNTVGFQGRNYDSSTGLQYFRARYLDATTGRFISADPLAFQDSPNHYSAFLNNGANYSDPMGELIRFARTSDRSAKRLFMEQLSATLGFRVYEDPQGNLRRGEGPLDPYRPQVVVEIFDEASADTSPLIQIEATKEEEGILVDRMYSDYQKYPQVNPYQIQGIPPKSSLRWPQSTTRGEVITHILAEYLKAAQLGGFNERTFPASHAKGIEAQNKYRRELGQCALDEKKSGTRFDSDFRGTTTLVYTCAEGEEYSTVIKWNETFWVTTTSE